jgi:prepilin-type N-terminal cleavage/methylation domain-containing protein
MRPGRKNVSTLHKHLEEVAQNMTRLRKKKNAGFTLIEIMIVVLIIAILLAIAIPNFLRARETSRAKSCQANMRQIETAKEQWAMDNKKGATDTPLAGDLVDAYMRGTPGELPKCPSGGGGSDYNVGDMSTRPTCGIGAQNGYDDHVLP